MYDAAAYGKPVIERVVTVSGSGIKNPRNIRVKVGTPISHVIEQCGGMVGTTGKVILGGPMTGFAQKDLSAFTQKGTGGVLVFTEEAVDEAPEQQCVGCDRCLDACAMFLMPNFIVKHARRGQWDLAEKYGAMDCFECGCCSFVCPARIKHVAYVRKSKAELAAAAKKS